MRVVSGDFRGLRLSAVPGMSTRPTTDKVKEALFNMIGPYFDAGTCLDLYGGSGGLAIEGISRGMDHAVVVDRAFPAIKTIRQNINKTHRESAFTVIKADARRAMKIMQSHQDRFDLVFLDPPYAKQHIQADMDELQRLNLLNHGAVIVAETNQEAQLPDEWAVFKLQKRQDYGITVIRIYRYDGGQLIMKVALFPGSFDPLTLGHLDLIKRGSALFDQLAVAVMTNTSKQPLFSVDERVAQVKEAVAGLSNVSVITSQGLTVDLMNQIGADYLLRGLRNSRDFEYEKDIAAMNQFLDDQVDTVFLLADPKYQHLSSSLLKEVAMTGGDISAYLPANINADLQKKLDDLRLRRVTQNNERQ